MKSVDEVVFEYSFCESASAGPHNTWHIRKLTSKGRKLGGGVDTVSLCGRMPITYGWDLDVPITAFHLYNNCCSECRRAFIAVSERKNMTTLEERD